ncbi:uncharacterized protein LOC134772596 [Penaeus indicus]|uniref:uncharacterized protein LOC134772596 n=1 Tax=Penaeus indicus TaxID=29960 RepID=UPI00300CA5C0
MPRHSKKKISLHEKAMKGVRARLGRPPPPSHLFLAATPEETVAASSLADMRKRSRISDCLLVKTPHARMGGTDTCMMTDGFTIRGESKVSFPEVCNMEMKDEESEETFIEEDITIKEEEPDSCDPLVTIPCKNCENVYATKCEMEVHLKAVHKEGHLLHCRNCNEKFPEESELALHSEVHVKRETLNDKVASEPSENLVWTSAARELTVNLPKTVVAPREKIDPQQPTTTANLTRRPTPRDSITSTQMNNSLNIPTPPRPIKKRKRKTSLVSHIGDRLMKALANVHKKWKNVKELNAPLDPVTESVKGFVRILNDRHPHLKAKFIQKVIQAQAEISQEFH